MNCHSSRLPCIFLVLLLAVGCSYSNTTSKNASVSSDYQDTVTLVTGPYGPVQIDSVANDSGYYECLLSADATANNILYTDFSTFQRVYLCSDPNCTHDSESCSSWFPYTFGGSYMFAAPDGQKLYYIQRGAEESDGYSEKSTGKIFAMNSDGSERAILLDLGANGRICDAIAQDSQWIYFDINTVDSILANPKKQFCRVDSSTGEVEILEDDLPSSMRIFGAFDSTLIFQNQDDVGTTYSSYDLKTGEFTDLISWNYGDLNGTSVVYGHYLFILRQIDSSQGELEIYDLRTMEKTVIQEIPLYAADATSFCSLYDEYLLIDVTDNADPSNIHFMRYMVDVVNHSVSELTLAYERNGYMRPLGIECDAGEYLLVRYEEYAGTVRTVSNGVPTDMKMDSYHTALIKKEDYFSNTPHYLPITDHVVSG